MSRVPKVVPKKTAISLENYKFDTNQYVKLSSSSRRDVATGRLVSTSGSSKLSARNTAAQK